MTIEVGKVYRGMYADRPHDLRVDRIRKTPWGIEIGFRARFRAWTPWCFAVPDTTSPDCFEDRVVDIGRYTELSRFETKSSGNDATQSPGATGAVASPNKEEQS